MPELDEDIFNEFIVEKGTDPKVLSISIGLKKSLMIREISLAAGALSDVVTNKLIEKLREDESGVYGVGARSSFREIPYPAFVFPLYFHVVLKSKRSDQLFSLELIEDIQKNGISDEDLEKVKESRRVDYKENIEQNDYWLSYLSSTDRNNRDPYRLYNYLDMVDALTTEDLQNVALQYLDENYFLAILYPEEVEEKVVEKSRK